MLKKPELLMPAGDLEKLETAYLYGADACYMGIKGFSLRTERSEIDFDEIKKVIDLARRYKKKIYFALNSFIYDSEITELKKILLKLNELRPDAIIFADPGVLQICHDIKNKIPLHLSTQANTLNSSSIKFWRDNGVKRIILARELSFLQLQEITKKSRAIELEIFVHGALCISYSGRCYLSKYLMDLDANRGECVQPCRWEYKAYEKIKPDRVLEFEQIDNTNYIMNSKDLCLIERLPQILSLNMASIKIEGRMKSAYYVAIVAMNYRCAIDNYFKNKTLSKKELSNYKKNLEEVSHRGYTTNFFDGTNDNTMNFEDSGYIKKYKMVGVIEKCDGKNIYINCRNEIRKDENIEIINYKTKKIEKFKVTNIYDLKKDTKIEKAHNDYYIKISSTKKFPPKSIIRNKI